MPQKNNKAGPESDLLYYGYRYLGVAAGRWLNRDPIEEAGGVNVHGFVLNDPLSVVDTDGRGPFDSPLARLTMWLQGRPPELPEPSGPDAWQLGRDFRDGTSILNRTFGPGDLMTEQLKRSRLIERRRNQMRQQLEQYCASGGGSLPIELRLGAELVDIPEWLFVPQFFYNLGTNPAEAFTGSFTDGSMKATEIYCSCFTARITIHAYNRSSADSATRFPPSFYGYSGGPALSSLLSPWRGPWLSDPNLRIRSNIYPDHMGPSSLFPRNPNGPNGPNGPLNTITQTYDWSETITFGSDK